MYLTLDEIKKHLNLDLDFNEDDDYLLGLAKVAINAVSIHIDRDFKELEDEEGNLPEALKHSLLLLIANYYNYRESISNVTANNIPFSYNYLLDLFKRY